MPIDRETRRVIATGDPLADHVRTVVGKSVQLRLPVRDPVDLRRQAAILREYANRIEMMSQSKDPADTIMLRFWAEGRQAQMRLQSRPQADRKKTVVTMGY